uniref:Uncharacterized protein n=1 Tax=Polytomella parva TaxID=51329 RepID=A0A7S0UTJ7_9CHLO|mmetsp:Transcript_21404/g.38247  ORF Transcript_21404/g.38247 Transcript_21404/m.38247 type:complete len:314 (+) Transcript_21404:762-1703(+)
MDLVRGSDGVVDLTAIFAAAAAAAGVSIGEVEEVEKASEIVHDRNDDDNNSVSEFIQGKEEGKEEPLQDVVDSNSTRNRVLVVVPNNSSSFSSSPSIASFPIPLISPSTSSSSTVNATFVNSIRGIKPLSQRGFFPMRTSYFAIPMDVLIFSAAVFAHAKFMSELDGESKRLLEESSVSLIPAVLSSSLAAIAVGFGFKISLEVEHDRISEDDASEEIDSVENSSEFSSDDEQISFSGLSNSAFSSLDSNPRTVSTWHSGRRSHVGDQRVLRSREADGNAYRRHDVSSVRGGCFAEAGVVERLGCFQSSVCCC